MMHGLAFFSAGLIMDTAYAAASTATPRALNSTVSEPAKYGRIVTLVFDNLKLISFESIL
jgi:hypothetical protein